MKLKPVIIIERNSLSFLTPEMAKKVSMTMEIKVFDDMEVKDSKVFSEQLKNFLVAKKLNIKEATLIISKNLLFYKNINKGTDYKKNLESFLSDIPLKPDDIATLEIDSEKSKTIICARRKLFMEFSNHLKNVEIIIDSVIPENVDKKKYSSQELLQLANNKNVYKSLNFLSVSKTLKEKDIPKEKKTRKFIKENPLKKEKKPKQKIKPLTILVPVFILVILLAGYLAYLKFSVKKEIPEEIVEETVIEEEVIETKPEITYLKKEEINIQILNGTGTPGLAGETSDKISKLGYTEISVGNADANQEATTVNYSEGISEDTLEEIINYLEETFEDVVEDELDEDYSEEFNIVVTTGKLLTE